MGITIDGAGTITGLDADGISAQPVFPGNVLQVVSANISVATTVSTASFVSTAINASITPASVSNKIYIITNFVVDVGASNNSVSVTIYRDLTELSGETNGMGRSFGSASRILENATLTYLDSPNTTSSVSYEVRAKVSSSAAVIGRNDAIATITLMEIAG